MVCDGLVRSAMTASWFRRMGFTRVFALAGGIPAWVAAGGALEPGEGAIVPAGHPDARRAVALVQPAALDGELGSGRPPMVLDVDQSDVYARRYVPGAGWLCRSRLEQRIGGVVPDRRRAIAVTCADGLASTLAAATLWRVGFSSVGALEGGTRAWAAAGLPLERGAARLLDEPDDVVLKPYEKGREAMEAYLRWEIALDLDGLERDTWPTQAAPPEST
jgi:rhodanese-related sulfurtransferase